MQILASSVHAPPFTRAEEDMDGGDAMQPGAGAPVQARAAALQLPDPEHSELIQRE